MTNEQSLREALEQLNWLERTIFDVPGASISDQREALTAIRQALSRPAMSEEDARELLAREYDRLGESTWAKSARNPNACLATRDVVAIAAIRAASERKEG